jgi:hypothetical protein
MKLLRTICACGMLALPATLPASSARSLQVYVPFSFMMAGQEFNPGDYSVRQDDSGIVLIQGNGKAAMALSSPSYSGRPGLPSSLQFTGEQGHKHLVGIHVEGEGSRALPVHREESRKLTFTSAR